MSSSRRLMERSLSGDGRSYYRGTRDSRATSRSYLSSVRSDNRSTLCSVMAQLAEETPPLFESTLKSKAVSEESNVKFTCTVSGHPVPDVTWYKDDTQLDRYCGLPKYEISRDDKTHTLQIYNCSLEDAAIYQASAQNSRGIVSCSGVLEVGTMSEYKIHQNYFAKLKQRNENRRREQEEPYRNKENVPASTEDLSMSSPERVQRKRRSPMETDLNPRASNPSEDTAKVEVLGQTPPENNGHLSSVQVSTAASVEGISSSEPSANKDSQQLEYIHDSVKASFKETKPKELLAKKKIKISTSAAEKSKNIKQAERTDVEMNDTSESVEKTKQSKNQEDQGNTSNVKKPAVENKNAQASQKPITVHKCPSSKLSMSTQTEMLEDGQNNDKNLLDSSNPQRNSNTTQPVPKQRPENSNPSSEENKLMDLDDHGNNAPVDGRVKISPHSSGDGDVNADAGNGNVFAQSRRGSDVVESHDSLTTRVKPTYSGVGPCHSLVQRQLERTGDGTGEQSMESVRNGGHELSNCENPQLREKTSSDLASSHQQVPNAKSLINNNILTGKNHPKAGKLANTQSRTKPMDTFLNKLKGNKPVIHKNANAHTELNTEEETVLKTSHSMNKTVTEQEKIIGVRSEAEKSQATTDSQNSNLLIKDGKSGVGQRISVANHAKTTDQEPSNRSSENGESAHRTRMINPSGRQQKNEALSTIYDTKMDAAEKQTDSSSDSQPLNTSTFLSEHSKVQFTIPAIYITDVDSTIHNLSEPGRSSGESLVEAELVKTSAGKNSKSNLDHKMDTSTTADESDCLLGEKVPCSTPYDIDQRFQESPEKLRNLENSSEEENVSQCNNKRSPEESNGFTNQDSNLKMQTKSFTTQLNNVAFDLEMTNRSFVNSKDIDIEQEVNSAVKISPKTANNHISSANGAECELVKAKPNATLPKNTLVKREVDKSFHKDSPKEKLTLSKIQSESLHQAFSNSTFKIPMEKSSPCLRRKDVTAESKKPAGNGTSQLTSAQREKDYLFKAPQVIRKIRPEVFDASGNLKLWCQFFNIISDSTINWYKDEVEIAEIKRSAGDEAQVSLAIVHMSKRDCGAYRCIITNEYGRDSTEYLLNSEILSGMYLQEEHQGVGEEIEMTPLIFSKGLANSGCWGSKFYGRVKTEDSQVGLGCEHKTKRLRVIYGLDPVFESGTSCLIKVRSPIIYESREETLLAERNLQITKQDCKIQNMAREYFKIFATETRAIEIYGPVLEVIPLYFIYCPASSVPYGTAEVELKGVYVKYCQMDCTGSLVFNDKSEVAQKCCSLQHWIYHWTSGNVLFTRLEGIDTILTNVGVAVRSKGYQGFPCEANPKVFEQFQTQHQCNYFCGLLNLKPLKTPETLQTATGSKSHSSPLLHRRPAPSSNSPQVHRKTTKSPKPARRTNPTTST